MSSANISGRPAGCISIPIEIVPASNSSFYSRNNFHNNYSDSPPSKTSTINSYSKTRFQPRPNPPIAYECLIKRSNTPLKTNGFRPDSDFIQSNSHHRSFDVLSDFTDSRSNYVNQIHVPTNHYSHDRSRSPASQRGESPTRPPPPPTSQQQQESDFKISKNTPNSSASTSLQSNDQQVPSTTDLSTRDLNTTALEKLEQMKQNLVDLNQQVDAFTGLTRNDHTYKLLDEQALKMMLNCDELINVSADIKEKRKEMIQNVQTVLAKLESKVPINPPIDSNSNQMESALVVYDPSINNTEQQNQETLIEQST